MRKTVLRNSKGRFIKGHVGIGNVFKVGHKVPKTWREITSRTLWKGDKITYSTLHKWLYKVLGNAQICQNKYCVYPRKSFDGPIMIKPKGYEWANISGKYKRDISDWMQLCISCHRIHDNHA